MLMTKSIFFKKNTLMAAEHISISSSNYFLTQFRVLVTYIRLLFFPINQNLDYDYPVYGSFWDVPVCASAVFLTFLMGFAIWLFRKKPLVSFGIVWFFITLLPDSSFIALQDVINEHRLYLPMVGFSIFLVSSLYHLFKRKFAPIVAVVILVSIFYSTLSYARNIVWQDELTLWMDVVEKSPNKARAYNGRGVAYGARGEYKKAIADYTKAIEISPTYFYAYNNRGVEYVKIGKIDEALSDFSKAIDIYPSYPRAYFNRAAILFARRNEVDKAIEDYNHTIQIDPSYRNAYLNRAVAYIAKGELDKAIDDFIVARDLDPRDGEVYRNLAVLYYEKGQYEKAGENVNRSLDLGYKVEPEFLEKLKKAYLK